jgi:SAM-dependent methyltransferase
VTALARPGESPFLLGAAEVYDAWYETAVGKAIFESEVQTLRPLIEPFAWPWLEVGAGTGRFARTLGANFGLDPSPAALRLAQERGLLVVAGAGEAAPFASGRFGAVLMAFTLCFLPDPAAAVAEACRLIADGGGLVVGFLPRGTPWADLYARQDREDHPIYRHARFYTVTEVEQLLTASGLQVLARRSTLHQPTGLERYEVEPASDFVAGGAGFVAVTAAKQA